MKIQKTIKQNKKVLIMFDDIKVDMEDNKNLSLAKAELF